MFYKKLLNIFVVPPGKNLCKGALLLCLSWELFYLNLRLFHHQLLQTIMIFWLKIMYFLLNPLIPGGNKKATYTQTNAKRSAVDLFKYVWPFCYHQALKG